MKVIIQIFGTKKCMLTRKVERFFSDRKIQYQFRDIIQKKPSKGELDGFMRFVSLEDLVDTSSSFYIQEGLSYKIIDFKEELLLHHELYKTPIIRFDNALIIGFDEKKLKELCLSM